MAKIHNCGFELLPRPAHFPDLVPSDFHLFPNLKKHLGGIKFSSNGEVHVADNEDFESIEEAVFKTGIMVLETRWNKCIELVNVYVKK